MGQLAQRLEGLGQKREGKRPFFPLILFIVGIIGLLLLAQAVRTTHSFSETWNLGLRDVLNEFKRWVVVNRNDHWLFVFFFEPLSAVIDFGLRRVQDLLLWLP